MYIWNYNNRFKNGSTNGGLDYESVGEMCSDVKFGGENENKTQKKVELETDRNHFTRCCAYFFCIRSYIRMDFDKSEAVK